MERFKCDSAIELIRKLSVGAKERAIVTDRVYFVETKEIAHLILIIKV